MEGSKRVGWVGETGPTEQLSAAKSPTVLSLKTVGVEAHPAGRSWRLLEQRAALDVTIHQLQNNIRHLARMCDVPVDDPIKQLGLTDAIRYVIGNCGKPITPVEVRDQLLRWYCKDDDYRNLLAAVHTVMKRVERAQN